MQSSPVAGAKMGSVMRWERVAAQMGRHVWFSESVMSAHLGHHLSHPCKAHQLLARRWGRSWGMKRWRPRWADIIDSQNQWCRPIWATTKKRNANDPLVALCPANKIVFNSSLSCKRSLRTENRQLQVRKPNQQMLQNTVQSLPLSLTGQSALLKIILWAKSHEFKHVLF